MLMLLVSVSLVSGKSFAYDSTISFDEALEESESGNLGEAITSFEQILQDQPELSRVRMELALAYYRAMDFSSARKSVNKVLDDDNIPLAVRNESHEFLGAIERADKRHTWSGFVNTGIGYDTNSYASPADSVINVENGTLSLGDRSEVEDVYIGTYIGGDHRYLSPNSMSFGKTKAAKLWNSGAYLYRADYVDESDVTVDVISLSTGPALIAAREWAAQLKFGYDFYRLDSDHLANFLSVDPEFTWELGTNQLTWWNSAQDRDYVASDFADRDSTYLVTGLNYSWNSLGGKFGYDAGVELFDEDADGSEYSNKGYGMNFEVKYRGFRKLGLFAGYSYRDEDYSGISTNFNNARNDYANEFSAGFNYPFTRWMINGFVKHTDNQSNVALYEYDRTQYEMNITRYFQ